MTSEHPRDPRAPFPERRSGRDRRSGPRPRGASPGRRFEDHLRAEPHLSCRGCGALWLSEIIRERHRSGDGCLRCGGELEEVAGAPEAELA